MAVTKKYDLAVKTGIYTVNGETKNRYLNVGAVMQGDNGPYIMLNAAFNPAGIARKEGSDSILISCFEPRQDGQQRQAPAKQEAAGGGDPGDDIPFNRISAKLPI